MAKWASAIGGLVTLKFVFGGQPVGEELWEELLLGLVKILLGEAEGMPVDVIEL